MELLQPSLSPATIADCFDGFSSPEGGDTVHVAVGKSVDKGVSLLNWTLKQFGNRKFCILHVHQPSPVVPTLLGKLPASHANEEVITAYRREERERMNELLNYYLSICSASKVNATTITIETVQVQKGIVDLVNTHGIRTLVMGALPENCTMVKRSSRKANYVAKNIPSFCEIWFIGRGKKLWIREASRELTSMPPRTTVSGSLRSNSLRCQKTELMFNPECLRTSSLTRMLPAWTKKWLQDQSFHCEVAFSPSNSNCTRTSDPCSLQISFTRAHVGTRTGYFPTEKSASSNSETKSEEESLYGQLIELWMEAEALKNEALTELLKRKNLESEAMKAIRMAKIFESAYAREVQLRGAVEDVLRTTKQEQEKLMEERKDITRELQTTMRNLTSLNCCLREANCRHDEAMEELKVIHASIATMRQEKIRSRLKKMKAFSWLDDLGEAGPATYNSLIGFGDLPELAEFSLSDVQSATCNFSESFRIGQAAYGVVYKGEILGKTVAIRKLHSHNMQGQSQFQQEVLVLSKLQHPHLVTLLGVCPEASSLIYEYLPNGSLQNRIFQKSNISPLTWKVRVQIISEISSALLFLHSSSSEKIIHGDLKLDNILLDFDLRCKICDFGTCRLVAEDTLQCSSFRSYTESKGAFPYADPEFSRTGNLTPKSDVYSFGLIILQILTGRPPVGLVGVVRKAVSCGNLASILDSSAGEWPPFVARRLVDLSLQCCELNSRDRPLLTPTLVRELMGLHMEEQPVPSSFLCPILKEIMHDPQVAADGFTYEGEALRGWLENGRQTSPMTNLKLSHLHLTPNHALRHAIQDWLCNQ